MTNLNLHSLRSRKARLANSIGQNGYRLLAITAIISLVAAAILWWQGFGRLGYLVAALAGIDLVFDAWYRLDLCQLLPSSHPTALDDIIDAKLLGSFKLNMQFTPQAVWQMIQRQWQPKFLAQHMLLDIDKIGQMLSQTNETMPFVWQKALELAKQCQAPTIDAGSLATALLLSTDSTIDYLSTIHLNEKDVIRILAWQQRLSRYLDIPKSYFGGIGRDWAAGFTPLLDELGENISHAVEQGSAGHFHTLAHSDILDSIIYNLSRVSGGVAIVGGVGVGKTSLTYALAQRLLEGHDPSLRYYQIISLNAAQILTDNNPKLEQTILQLFAEAVHARNIIIYLDDAQLFFGTGTGALDMGQVLAPILKNHALKIIAAFTPNDFQHLKVNNELLADYLTAINVTEAPADTIIDILEDTALTIEQHNDILVSFEAIREAFRLSGQYFQDQSYPGKAIKILEQAIPYCQNQLIMTATAVQSAIEKTLGVKVAIANAPEADVLLHLEDYIHRRMINQVRATTVVAAALRRGRAGVANPNRPIGSFLFLGPTGVGKTELARSLAATYYGNVQQIIRLDMSEYQQPEDIERILMVSAGNNQNLLIAIRQQPFSVILLDEIEKAHPNFLNLLLQMLDEGNLTDKDGKTASFKNAIIICTSNAGAVDIIQHINHGDTLDTFEQPLINQLIEQQVFKPELINRFDEIVLFRPLSQVELGQVAQLMVNELNNNLAKQNISVSLTPAAMESVIKAGYSSEFGARPMRHTIQQLVENSIAGRILRGQAKSGDHITLDINDLGH